MFNLFYRIFSTRRIGVVAGLALTSWPLWGRTKEQDRIDEKLVEKFEAKYHNKHGMGFHFSPEARENMLIFTGNSNKELASQISGLLGLPLGRIRVGRFNDGEIDLQVLQTVRGKDVYLIQPTSPPSDENLMELLLMIATMRQSHAGTINVIVPYFGYARAGRKSQTNRKKTLVYQSDIPRMIEAMGADRVVVVDIHSGQIQGFFECQVPVDNLESQQVALNYFLEQKTFPMEKLVVVSPDPAGVGRATQFASLLNKAGIQDTRIAMVAKHSLRLGEEPIKAVTGIVEGRNAIIIDDLIDSGKTITSAAQLLKKEGACNVACFATHGIFSGTSMVDLCSSRLSHVIVTNTTAKQPDEQFFHDCITRLSVAPILAEAMFRIQNKMSISSLFAVSRS